MTLARIQPFCKKYEIDLGYFNGKEVWPRTVKERKQCLYLHNNHFCCIWGDSLKKAVEEVESNFKLVNNYVISTIVNNHREYNFKPKKIESQLANVCVYDIETYNKDRAVPYAIGFYPVTKLCSKWNRDLTQTEIDKCLRDVRLFEGEDCITNMFERLRDLKGEPRKIMKNGKEFIVEYDLKLVAHNGSGFDTWIILNNLPKECKIMNMIKNGKGIISLKIYNGMVDVKANSKGKPQYLTFVCSMNHMKSSLRKLGETYKLQPELLKQEMNHEEIYEDTWQSKRSEWEPYLRMDILSLAFIYARYSMNMSSITGFGMKGCLSLPSLGWKHFMSSRTESDEKIYSYTDKYMRQAIKGGKTGAFNQSYESPISEKIFTTISNELNVNGNKYEITEAYYKYIKGIKNNFEAEYLSNYSDYRQVKQQDKEKYIIEKLSELDISKKLRLFNRNDLLMTFDATSLYPSAMYDEMSIYPKIETGYAFTKDMNDEIVNQFNTKTFTKSAILKIKYYNPKDTILQHIPVKEEVNKVEVNRLRNGYIDGVLTSVDIQEIVRIGGKVVEVYEGVIYKENYKISPFRDFIKNLFDLRLKYKSEGQDILQEMVKLNMNSIYQTIRRDIEDDSVVNQRLG